MIPGSANALLLATAAAEGGYQIERSLRFNSSDSAYLSRDFVTSGDRKTWTWAGWVKRSSLGSARQTFFGAYNGSSGGYSRLAFSGDVIWFQVGGSATAYRSQTAAVYRDVGAWMHIVAALDTTQAVDSDRVKLWVNGELQTFGVTSYPPLNWASGHFNQGIQHAIGAEIDDATNGVQSYCDLYLADVHFIDGQALDPTSFTEVDATTGQLVPIAYSGTYGTNGFHLPFSDNSTAAALGTDTSGNGNTWTVNNISVTAGANNDSLVDSPTNFGEDTGVGGEVVGNYCTWNPLASNVNATAVNGNLQYVAGASTDWQSMMSTIGVSSGKWYCEVTANVDGTGGKAWFIGVAASEYPVGTANYFPGITANSWGYYGNNGNKYNNNAASAYGASYTTNNIIGIAIDLDNGKLFFSKNGTWQASGDPVAGTNAAYTNLTGTIHVAIAAKSTGSATLNAGARPFAYTAPSGYKALCTTNLPDPVVAKPSEVMDVKLYTGNGSTQTISGLGFSPDFLWFKARSIAYSHALYDTVRGYTKSLVSNSTVAEGTEAGGLSAFNSDGFSLNGENTVYGSTNTNGQTYVAWAWDAGSSTVTNTAGSITSQVRANASAGFSICTFTTPASGGFSFGHGLGVAPAFVTFKFRNVSSNWYTYHTAIGQKYIILNSTGAAATNEFTTAPTSTIFTYPSSLIIGGNEPMVAYCFAPVNSYSAFGSYTGNGSADGPFVFLGFRPAVVIVKMSSSTGNWTILDDKREGYNVDNDPLFPNLSNAEGTTDLIDITSNGFKVRTTDATFNTNAGTYVYAAWASSPFAYARAR